MPLPFVPRGDNPPFWQLIKNDRVDNKIDADNAGEEMFIHAAIFKVNSVFWEGVFIDIFFLTSKILQNRKYAKYPCDHNFNCNGGQDHSHHTGDNV